MRGVIPQIKPKTESPASLKNIMLSEAYRYVASEAEGVGWGGVGGGGGGD